MTDMDMVYKKLQGYFAEGNMAQGEDFLIEMLKKAQQEQDYNGLIMLLNEMIGLCRESGQKEKSLGYSSQVLTLMEQLGMKDSQAYATTLVNVATACRAAGKHTEAYRLYMEVFPLYEKWLPQGDPLYASLYNNMSLLFQEMEEYERAVECQEKALALLEHLPDKTFEIAVTRANMASSLCKLAQEEKAGEIASLAARQADIAMKLFQSIEREDVHTAAAMAAFGDAMTLLEDYEVAAGYYERALGLLERLVGKTESYQRVAEKLAYAKSMQGVEHVSGLQLARDYFEEYGKPMLMREFPDEFDQMAVGLCGEGSDCLGFDDAVSTDHDHGSGFAIWISTDLYEKIGKKLAQAYEKLPKVYRGYERIEMPQAKGRVGVCTYEQYFLRILGIDHPPRTMEEWVSVEEYALRAAISGEIFHDPSGVFSGLCKEIKTYYPDRLWKQKLKQEYALFEQCGPYNYPRMLQRKDYASANLLLAEAIQHGAKLLYLLEREYAPHTKWLLRGLRKFDKKVKAYHLLTDLIRHLDSEKAKENMMSLGKLTEILGEYMKVHLVEEIVEMEWKAFDRVENEGGRAGCQDDFMTFEIMRKSQYLTWTAEMLSVYIQDFLANIEKGWNPITEKYARMMESTAPKEYEELKAQLSPIPEEKKAIMEEIIAIQVSWMESFAEKYPKVAGNARSIHTYEDSAYNTSYETYLRGEIGTYSDEMLLLYGAFVARLASEGKNLAYLTMENTVHMYGYETVEDAENKMW